MDLSYILNSPDIERIASSLETIASKTIDSISQKLDKNQGTSSAGETLMVGSDGNIITEKVAAVLYDKAQPSITTSQKELARNNINAANADDIIDISINNTTLVIQHSNI